MDNHPPPLTVWNVDLGRIPTLSVEIVKRLSDEAWGAGMVAECREVWTDESMAQRKRCLAVMDACTAALKAAERLGEAAE